MSKKSNVHPDHYKTAGRDRQGEDIVQEQYRQEYAQDKAEQRNRGKATPNFIPGASPVEKSGTLKKKPKQ